MHFQRHIALPLLHHLTLSCLFLTVPYHAGAGVKELDRSKLTKQQLFARRWRLDLSGNGKEHARKLVAAGVIVLVRDSEDRYFKVRDMKPRPVETVPEKLSNFKDSVLWINMRKESLTALGKELQLTFVPTAAAIIIPKDREKKMADAEAKHAQRESRPLEKINETWFDFRMRNGALEPVVIRQK
jgi:hypothetical protein